MGTAWAVSGRLCHTCKEGLSPFAPCDARSRKICSTACAFVKDCSLTLPVAVSPYRAPLEISAVQEMLPHKARGLLRSNFDICPLVPSVPFFNKAGSWFSCNAGKYKARGCVLLSPPSGMTPRRTGKVACVCVCVRVFFPRCHPRNLEAAGSL